jgi:multiple sugar transport system substrate-binding protein
VRPPSQCGFGERPGISRQSGSSLCISRYSKAIDAAWVFLQWATSSDVTSRACILGGGSNPIRASNYRDPRVLEGALAQNSDTRHFTVALDAIRNRMGCDPQLPQFPDIAVEGFAVELGKMTTGQQGIRSTAKAMARASQDALG